MARSLKQNRFFLAPHKKGPILQTVQKASEEGFGANKIKQSVGFFRGGSALKLDKSEHNLQGTYLGQSAQGVSN